MNSLIRVLMSLLCLTLPLSAYAGFSPTSVPQLDLQRYMGTWYEIAAFPNYFQKGCRCTTANYKLEGSVVRLLNRCIKNDDATFSTATGKAWRPDAAYPGRLKVQFFWPFRAKYWVLAIDPEYQYALVGTPNRDYAWILSRSPELDPAIQRELTTVAQKNGYDVQKFHQTLQNCAPSDYQIDWSF